VLRLKRRFNLAESQNSQKADNFLIYFSRTSHTPRINERGKNGGFDANGQRDKNKNRSFHQRCDSRGIDAARVYAKRYSPS